MRIASIEIHDTFGTRHAKFTPGSVTRITGPNGSGKSSIIRALAKIFEGGHDPSSIRAGADKSIVEVKLDDGTIITRTVQPVKRRKGEDPAAPVKYRTDLEIIDPDGTPRSAPQTFVNELSEAIAVDPGQILRIDATTAPGKKQLAEILLRIMPIRFEPEEIRSALDASYRPGAGVATLDVSGMALPAVETALDLDGLKAYAYKVTEQRRRVGQTKDESDGAVSRLQKSLPEGDKDPSEDLARAEQQKSDISRNLTAQEADVLRQKTAAMMDAKEAHLRAEADADDVYNAAMARVERERAVAKAAAMAEHERKRGIILTIAEEELQQIRGAAAPALDSITGEIGQLKAQRDAYLRAATLRQEIDIQLAAHRKACGQYEQLTEVLARLEKLRTDKLQSLPVPGLEVAGDQTTIDGILWQNTNTARRVEVALQLCGLRSGKLGIHFLDDAEHLDAETRRLVEQGISDAGFQLFEAIVSDADKLTIETFEPQAA